jgi:SAM-dependent methyltransferase
MPRDAYSEAAAKFNAIFAPPHADGVAKVLDVGSCYNPFGRSEKAKGWLDVTAVDLEPSERAPDVKRCDWLEVATHDTEVAGDEGPLRFAESAGGDAGGRPVQSIRRGAFDVVVMSYLLSFLPSAQLRLRAVRRAFACLRPGGVLVIVEARRGGHRVGGWPARWTAAIEDAGVSGCDALRVRQDVMKKSVGLVFAAGLTGLGYTNLRKASAAGADAAAAVVPCMTFDHEIEDAP